MRQSQRWLGLALAILFAACVPTSTAPPATLPPTLEPPSPPTLRSPGDGATFDTPAGVTLDWAWERPLTGSEFYDVRVWREGDPEAGITWTALSNLNLDRWLADQEAGTFYWSIAVLAGQDGQVEKWITEPSAPRHFTVDSTALPTATPSPTETPLPPTATPVTEFDPSALLGSPEEAEAMLALRTEQLNQAGRNHYYSIAHCEPGPDWTLDTTSLAAYEASIAPWRAQFAAELNATITVPENPPTVLSRETLVERDGIRYEYVIFESPHVDMNIHGYLLTPEDAPSQNAPAVIAIHGTESSPEQVVLLRPEDEDYALGFGLRMAQAGLVVFAPYAEPDLSQRTILEFTAQLGSGATATGLHLENISAGVDFLQAQPNVDPARIGVYGISWGGLQAMWSAALDTRIKAAVVSSWARDFSRWVYRSTEDGRTMVHMNVHLAYLPADFWCRFDSDRVGALLAPRHVLYEYGLEDNAVSLGDPTVITGPLDQIAEIYDALGIPEHFTVATFSGGHEANGEAAIPWLVEVLGADE